MATEQILEKIKKERGEDSLGDGRSLLGLFMDYSNNQLRPQANALRTFLDCGGNECILNLRNAPKQKQQVAYHRLIQEMVRDYNMQEATAADVCAAFWRVAIGTQPPASRFASEPQTAPAPKQEPESMPKQEPEQRVNPNQSPRLPSQPRVQKPKLSHTPLEITTFSIGWLLIGMILISFVSALLEDPNPVSNVVLFAYITGMALFGGMQYLLWKQKILQWDMCSGLMAFFGLMMALLVPGLVLEGNGAFTWLYVGIEACGLYIFLWNLIPILEKRKNKKGGKK